MNHQELLSLFDAYMDGTITEAQVDRAAELLSRDKQALAWFIRELEFHNLLVHSLDDFNDSEGFAHAFWERLYAEETAARFCHDFEKTIARDQATDILTRTEATWEAHARHELIRTFAEEAFARFRAEERRRQQEIIQKEYIARRRRFVIGGSALAALSIIVAFVWFAGNHNAAVPLTPAAPSTPVVNSTSVVPPALATITRSYKAQWERSDMAAAAGTELAAGSIKLSEGFVELTFTSGAKAIVEAPARLVLLGERQARMHSGRLTAYIPKSARGFVVDTPSVYVMDLGTEFALWVNEDELTDVHVLSGMVTASFTAPDYNDTQRVRTLGTDSAMRFDVKAGTVKDIPVDTQDFALSWDDVLYKPQVDGSIRFEHAMPASLRKDAFESDDAVVFLEATDITLSSDMAVDITKPGTYQNYRGLAGVVPAGLKVDSYLLHFDPTIVNPGERESVTGSITFPRPILGLIVTYDRFVSSERILGHPYIYPGTGGTVSREWGLESGTTRLDTIEFSQDRRTIQVALWADSMDHIRVIVTAVNAERGVSKS